MACLHSYMLNRAQNGLSLSPRRSPFLRILWSKPTLTHCVRASWRPSTKTQCFATFAKTDRGGLHQNPNVLPFLSWHPSKPRNIHTCLLTAKLSKNTAFAPAHTTTWHPSKITNSPSRQHSDRAQKRSAKKILKNLCGLRGSARACRPAPKLYFLHLLSLAPLVARWRGQCIVCLI